MIDKVFVFTRLRDEIPNLEIVVCPQPELQDHRPRHGDMIAVVGIDVNSCSTAWALVGRDQLGVADLPVCDIMRRRVFQHGEILVIGRKAACNDIGAMG